MLQLLFNIYLLIVFLQNSMALRIWVKPSNLHYKAEVICHQWQSAHFVGSEHAVVKRTLIIRTEIKHSADFEDLWIKTDLSSCDQNDPKAFIRITRLNSHETKQFDLIKTELLRRQSPVILGFNIQASAYKMFFVYQSIFFALCRRCRSLDYELEIFCDFIQSNGKTQRFAIGGGIQKKGQKYANIPIYEIELLASCDRDRIEINIYFSESDVAKKANLKTTRAFLLQSDAFNVDIALNSIQPNVVAQRAPTLPEASSSRSSIEVQSVQNAKGNYNIRCVICDDKQRQVAFIPCGHWCTCSECSTGVINLGMNCPICRCSISGTLQIQKTAVINTQKKPLKATSLVKPNECFCVFCEGDQQREIAFIPCGHFFACRKCSEEKLGSKCSVCRCLVKDTLRIYP